MIGYLELVLIGSVFFVSALFVYIVFALWDDEQENSEHEEHRDRHPERYF